MSLQEETRTLGEELDRLDAELDDVVDQLTNADEDAGAGAAMLQNEMRDLEQAGQAVAALVDEYGPDAEVTVRGLDAIEFSQVENKVSDASNSRSTAGEGTGSLVYAAHGLVDAPWFDDGIGADDLDAKIQAFDGLPPGARVWVESLVDDLGQVDEGNWRPLQERIADATSTN